MSERVEESSAVEWNAAVERPARARLFSALLIAAVLLTGIAVSTHLMRTTVRAPRKTPQRQARLVEVAPVQLGSHATSVDSMGTVVAARRLEIRPRVAGAIVEMSSEFVPGGFFDAGDVIARIDPRDYELVLEQRRSELAEAESALAIESGNQDVAKREFELLGEVIGERNEKLVLREPQLRSAQARVRSARAAVAAAKLALERTTVRAPFAAVVQERNVEVGTQVDLGTAMGVLLGTNEYWIEAAVPVDQLRWISIPGAAVRVRDEAAWGPDSSRPGEVIRLYSDLENQGRMARVLVSVPDPLGLDAGADRPPILLLGSYVRVEIEGATLDDVAAVDRRLLRDGDNVWVMSGDDTLEIRPVAVAFRGSNHVLVSAGLAQGERLVATDLPAPVPDMPLRLAEELDRG